MSEEKLRDRWRNEGMPDAKKLMERIAALEAENAGLREALAGVVRVADRETTEFIAARAAAWRTLSKKEQDAVREHIQGQDTK